MKPAEFYARLSPTSRVAPAILFYLLVNSTGILLSFFTTQSILVTLLNQPFLKDALARTPFPWANVLWFANIAYVPISFLLVLVALLAFAAFTHLFLILVGGGAMGFSTTLCAIAYASAPTAIPCVGWIWASFIVVSGLAHAHKTDIWKPVLALTLESCVAGAVILIPILFAAFNISKALHP